MHLLQAAWNLDGLFVIWGERGGAFRPASEQAQNASGETHSHPFACSPAELEQALNALGFEADAFGSIELSLPSTASGPLPPNRLQPADEPPDGAAELRWWEAPAAFLRPAPAIALLTSLPEHPGGVKLDDSFRFWQEPTRLLLELLTRGRFVPGMMRKNRAWHSHWHLVPSTTEDRLRLSVIAECMPPVCRALLQKNFGKNAHPRVIVESFVAACGDALIRSFLKNDDFLSPAELQAMPPRLLPQAAWAISLTKADGQLTGPEYELMKLEQRLRIWAGALLAADTSHSVRTAFRLRPPPADGADARAVREAAWVLEFVLQSVSSPEQELPAERLWRGDLGFLQNSDLTEEDLEEQLLKDLGAAVEMLPKLRDALKSNHPRSLVLNTEEAYNFLRHESKKLEQHGFTVLLPSWWNSPSMQLGLHLHVDANDLDLQRHGGFGSLAAHELLDYSWEVSLGDRRLSLDEFRVLVSAAAPLFPSQGQWIELQPKKLAATLGFLERQEQQKQRLQFIDVLRIGLGVQSESDLLPVIGFSASGWIGRLLNREIHQFSPLSEPAGFSGSLRRYQQEGLGWLAMLAATGVGGCLADDMGLGKTVQTLALLLWEREGAIAVEPPQKVAPTLLIVPMSILNNWAYETGRFAPSLKVLVHHGPGRLTGKEFKTRAEESDIVVTTYSLANRDEDLLAGVRWGRIALDEAQNIKNLEAKQTKAIKRLAQDSMLQQPGGFCQRLALTGTPLENHLEELWSIFDFLNPNFLGTAQEFRTRFALPIESYRSKESASLLNRLIRPFVLRRLKADPQVISDLPEKIEMEVYTSLTEEQAALYQSVLDSMFPQIESARGIHRKGLVLAAITRLKQICDHPTLFLRDQKPLQERSGKLALLEEILEVVLAEGDRALVFTQYAQMGHLLKPYLQEKFDEEILFLHGSLGKAARQALLDKFRKTDGPRIFVLSLKAGGLGLNLTEANQVIHFDQWWNPAVQDQATDRAYRIGQTRTVQVRKFICKGTLEEKIHQMLGFKRNLMDQVVGSTRNAILELSTDELRGLLQLSSEALA